LPDTPLITHKYSILSSKETNCFLFEIQPVYVVYRNNNYVLRELYETHTVWENA